MEDSEEKLSPETLKLLEAWNTLNKTDPFVIGYLIRIPLLFEVIKTDPTIIYDLLDKDSSTLFGDACRLFLTRDEKHIARAVEINWRLTEDQQHYAEEAYQIARSSKHPPEGLLQPAKLIIEGSEHPSTISGPEYYDKFVQRLLRSSDLEIFANLNSFLAKKSNIVKYRPPTPSDSLPIKERTSFLRKVKQQAGGDPTQVLDLLASTIECPGLPEMHDCLGRIQNRFGRLVTYRDRIRKRDSRGEFQTNPISQTGYPSILLNFRLPNLDPKFPPIITETQIVLAKYEELSHDEHILHKIRRVICNHYPKHPDSQNLLATLITLSRRLYQSGSLDRF